jgi:hypothetical protein
MAFSIFSIEISAFSIDSLEDTTITGKMILAPHVL